MKLSQVLTYFAIYEVVAFVVNKQAGAQQLPFDLISQWMPAPPPPAAPLGPAGTLAVQSPVGRLTLTTPLITAGGAITS